MTNEFAAMLMAKLYLAMAGLNHTDTGGYGGIYLNWKDEARVIRVRLGEEWHELVQIPEGKTPDEWIADGRRNWRTIRKFADSIKAERLADDIAWMFEDSTEGTILGDVDMLEGCFEDEDDALTWIEDMIEPSFDRERAEKLQPNHPLFARYDALIVRAKEFISQPDFRARVEDKKQRDAETAEVKRIEDRTAYVMDEEARREADKWVARSNAFMRFSDCNDDLRQMFADGFDLWEIIEAI
ncbi:MAG: hypothetical protein ACRCUJ_12955 [Phocaeicola sp.]